MKPMILLNRVESATIPVERIRDLDGIPLHTGGRRIASNLNYGRSSFLGVLLLDKGENPRRVSPLSKASVAAGGFFT
jgi:hypothetical protein